MSSPPDPCSQPGGAPDPGLSFVEAWAALVRRLALRAEAPGELAAALTAYEAASCGRPLRVVFARSQVRVAGRTFALEPESPAHGLAVRLETCGVAGALFEPGLRAPSLLAFSRQVLDGARRAASDLEFEHGIGDAVEHVHVLQRRFEGLFEGPLGETGRRPLSLLRRVVESLPGHALDDPHGAADHVLQLVRDGDGADDDDLSALELELAELPLDAEPQQALAPFASAAESLGVYLTLLTTLDDEREVARLHAPLARLVRDAGASGRTVLESYLAPLREDARRPADERSRRRLTGFLCEFDLVRVLADHGAFGTALAAQRFPEDLQVWLDGLDLARAEDHARICALFEAVGAQRVLRAGPLLLAEARLGDPARAAALLARAHPALVPVARLLLARGVPVLTMLVARFVRELAPAVPEACLLELLDDAELPGDVLAGLLDAPRTPGARASLRSRVAEALCEIVERPAADADQAARRRAAAQHLAGHDCPHARQRLQALLDARAGGPTSRDEAELLQALQRALEGGA